MTNRLADQTSPYLLQHAENPVDWWPWSDEAFAEARASNRPVLLSVGYAACHWCHVMAHESFENAAIAEVMNRLFVNIKVDREERPDVDQIYMAALHALGQQGGWPLTMFLTPQAEPFWGGTYFPPADRYGRPGFPAVLEAVARTYAEDPEKVRHNTAALLQHLRAETPAAGALDAGLPDLAARRLAGVMDPRTGGLQGAPKFPQPSLLALLFRHAARSGDRLALEAALTAIDRMSQGGIYDHLGGGYARYAVDDRWLVPHFEKMLYDNGQLLGLLARAFAVTGDPLFRLRIEETVAWLLAEMRVDGGGFASSLDADTEGEEGLTYLWTEAEIDAVLGGDADAFKAVYGVTAAGNFEGRTILNRLDSGPLRSAAEEDRLRRSRERLKAVRDRRPQPGRDDKVLADWNGLAIAGLAASAALLGRAEWLDAAATAFNFVRDVMGDGDGRLAHATRAGRFVRPGLASDHAAMAVAAVALHQATLDEAYLDDAARWLGVLDRHHSDGAGLYFLPADDAGGLIVRPKPLIDEATPNHHALIVEASVRLHLLTGDAGHLERADRLLAAAGGSIAGNVLGTASLLAAFVLRLEMATVVIVGPHDRRRDALVAAARRARPDAVLFVAESTEGLPDDHPAADKPAGPDPVAYVCSGSTCSLPITDPAALGTSISATE